MLQWTGTIADLVARTFFQERLETIPTTHAVPQVPAIMTGKPVAETATKEATVVSKQ